MSLPETPHHDNPAQTLPEAPISISGRVAVPGLCDHPMVTGRGHTGKEAAQNFKTAADEILALYAPPPLPSREARLSSLLACATLKAVHKGDFALVTRLTKAFCLAVKGHVEATATPGAYAVRSQRDPALWYTVQGTACSCPDWGKHAQDEVPFRCKHLLAVLMDQRVDTAEATGE